MSLIRTLSPRPARRRRGHRRRGAAAVEFALTFPIVALILLGSLEFGWYFTRMTMVTGVVNDAARVASFQDSQVAAIIQAENAAIRLANDLGFNCNLCIANARARTVSGIDVVELEFEVPYDQLTGLIPAGNQGLGGILFDPPDTLRGRAVMPIAGCVGGC